MAYVKVVVSVCVRLCQDSGTYEYQSAKADALQHPLCCSVLNVSSFSCCLDHAMTRMTCIRTVPGSNPGRDITSVQPPTVSFQIISGSPLTNHLALGPFSCKAFT